MKIYAVLVFARGALERQGRGCSQIMSTNHQDEGNLGVAQVTLLNP